MNDPLLTALRDLQNEVQCECWKGPACTQDCYAHRATFRALCAVLDLHTEGRGVGPGRRFRYCRVCDQAMPCDERQAIADALGVRNGN